MGRVTSIVFYMRIMAILWITTKVVNTVDNAIIGYDCGNNIQNIRTISLLDIDDCDSEADQVKTSSENKMLLEISKYKHLEVTSLIKSLYLDVVRLQCQLKKGMLKNTLGQPDEFAFRYMAGPGYMAVVAGEVINIVQCVPVKVKLNPGDKCYNRLPVLRNDTAGNDTVFLTPRTHIITKYATEIPCNPALLEQYKLSGKWYTFLPKPEPVRKPSTKNTLNYQSLAKEGMYRQIDLDTIAERIMFPLEQTVIAESVAQQFTKCTNGMGGPICFSSVSSIWSTIWGKLIGFGTICASFIGIFVILYLLKTVVHSVIHGYALYKMYGWSFNLLGACWNTASNISPSKGTEKKETSYQDTRTPCSTDNTHQVPTAYQRRFHE